MTLTKACFLDRDGVLVRAFPESETTRGPRTIEEIEYLPGVRESCQKLRQDGYKLVMVTNQPDVARGAISRQDAEAICREVMYAIPLDAYYVCPHDGHWCACRKPRAGLIYQAAVEHELDLSQCWMIGDRETDIQAGEAAGCQTVKVETNHGIGGAVQWILANPK